MSQVRPFFRRLPALLLVVALAAGAAFGLGYAFRTILFPFPVDYAEGPLLDQAARLAQFDSVYRLPADGPPHTVANYPPLYPAVVAVGVRVFGPGYSWGRLLSWLSAVASAILAASIVRRLTRDRTAAATAGLLLFVSPYLAYWSPLMRVDCLALALSLGGLYAVVRPGERPRSGWPMAAALLLTAAVFTRQSYGLAAPLAAFVWCWTSGSGGRRRAWRLAGLVAALGVGAFVLLELVTGGGFFFNVVTANANAFRLERLARFAGEALKLFPVPLALAAVFAVTCRRMPGEAWRLVAPYLAGSLFAALTIGKTGSNVNYLLELSAALALAAGALLAGLGTRPVLAAAASLALAVQALIWLPDSRYRQHVRWKTGAEVREVQVELARIIEDEPGPVLADEDIGLLPLARRPVYFQPFEMTQLARDGAWDPAPFLAALEGKEFGAILIYRVPWSPIHETRWTPEMLERIERHYAPAGSVGYTVIYRPRALDPR